MVNIEPIQKKLQELKIDGWLLYDFKRSNPIALNLLKIPETSHLTRRFFYWIPSVGIPIKIVSAIENPLAHLSGKESRFQSWQQLDQILKETVHGTVAMEYFPDGAIPALSFVDGGTYEKMKRYVDKIVSSDVVWGPLFVPLTKEQIASHKRAADHLNEIVALAYLHVHQYIGQVDECGLQSFIEDQFKRRNLVTEGLPIIAVNKNSANPHYAPIAGKSACIERDSLLLIDLWAKENLPGAVFADFTRMATTHKRVPDEIARAFDQVKCAQLKAIEFVRAKRGAVLGYEVDRAARDYLKNEGVDPFFLHRTGHNIHETLHGPGANFDDLETHDTRELLPATITSVEPGLYYPEAFGIRLECNLIYHENREVEITGQLQEALDHIFI